MCYYKRVSNTDVMYFYWKQINLNNFSSNAHYSQGCLAEDTNRSSGICNGSDGRVRKGI